MTNPLWIPATIADPMADQSADHLAADIPWSADGLMRCFDLISQEVPSVYLLLVGPEEASGHLTEETRHILVSNPRVICAGRQTLGVHQVRLR